MKPRVLLTFAPPQSVLTQARQRFDVLPDTPHDLTPEAVVMLAKKEQPEGLIISAHQRLGAAEIAALPASVRIIATCSVGFDHVDGAAAKQRQIIVTNTPDVLTDCTADFAFMLILAACRRVRTYSEIMRAGWGRAAGLGEALGTRVTGKTLGIFGMGRIGQAVARRARGFEMRVLYTNRRRLPESQEEGATYVADLKDLLPQTQILSLHAPSTAHTRHIIGAQALGLLPRGAVLVNTARGALVDEAALIAALKSGHIAAAGLDVMQNEPHLNTELAAQPEAFLMPHMGSATVETRHAMGMRAIGNAQAVLTGGAPLDPV